MDKLRTAADKIREAQRLAKASLMSEMNRVSMAPAGMGFVSITAGCLEACGVPFEAVEVQAVRMGLSLVPGSHGKHGRAFSRKSAS